jgi:hypothetical protein
MRLTWVVMMIGVSGCTITNPAFFESAGDETSGGPGGGESSGSAGSTTRPVDDSTGEPSPTTSAGTSASTSATTSTATEPDPMTSADAGTTSPGTTDSGETTADSTTDPNNTTGPEGSSGTTEAICGDGLVEGDEKCDGGPQVEPTPGKCSLDCQAIVQEKRIFAFKADHVGSFDSLEMADALCQEFAESSGWEGEFKALLSDGVTRVGSLDPFDGQATDDWPLHPHTAYFNEAGQFVWTTWKLPLLGVSPGLEGAALHHPIQPGVSFAAWTGLQSDWRTGANCEGWMKDGAPAGIAGKPYTKDFYLHAASPGCDTPLGLICVQQ